MRFRSKYNTSAARWDSIGLYLLRVGLACSVLINVILRGESNQTTSARLWELYRTHNIKAYTLVDFIAEKTFGDELHCLKAWINWRLIKHTLHVSGHKIW